MQREAVCIKCYEAVSGGNNEELVFWEETAWLEDFLYHCDQGDCDYELWGCVVILRLSWRCDSELWNCGMCQ